MRLFLIRHGETVDNVAQVYAGSRDSELTNHGVQQASRLGLFFSSTAVTFTHIFSSHLRRAVRTAELIRDGQHRRAPSPTSPLKVTRVPLLREQDFGSLEGVSFISRPYNFKSGKESSREGRARDLDFVEMETRESMHERLDAFLDVHLIPLVHSSPAHEPHTVAVVSHGITLSVLWGRILQRLPDKSVSLIPELVPGNGRPIDLERLGGWTNTGFLEIEWRRASAAVESLPPPETAEEKKDDTVITHVETVAPGLSKEQEVLIDVTPPTRLHGWTTTIKVINGRDHLTGLKRTRGGLGSAKHDEKQKSLDSFFEKKRKS